MSVATLRTKATLESDLGFSHDLINIKSTALLKILRAISNASSLEEVRAMASEIESDAIAQHKTVVSKQLAERATIAAATYSDEETN